MNLVDFVVTKILEERRGKVYELYGMTETEAREKAKGNKDMETFLFFRGCYAEIRIRLLRKNFCEYRSIYRQNKRALLCRI